MQCGMRGNRMAWSAKYRFLTTKLRCHSAGVEFQPMPEIRTGTSAFTADGWEGSFYPKGMKPADYLTYYSTKFDAVELDNTFYRTPCSLDGGRLEREDARRLHIRG
jgi:hypothetical protein